MRRPSWVPGWWGFGLFCLALLLALVGGPLAVCLADPLTVCHL